jgi:cell division transport system permease protein
MKTWLRHHARAFAAAFTRICRSPGASLLNVAVIGVALGLPLGGYVVLGSLEDFARAHTGAPQVSVFMALDATDKDTAHVRDRLGQHPQVSKFIFVPRDQALRELRASTGLADVVDSLPHNPLPDAFVVDPKEADASVLEALRDELRKWPRVAHVQLDSAWARRLEALLRVGRYVIFLAGAGLALGMIVITFNTIRLQILTQREEIEVCRLIGATDSFIRRPFLYYGALLGACGGGAAWALVCAGAFGMNHSLSELGGLYGANLNLRPLTRAEGAGALLVAASLCWIGAWVCVQRHLGAKEPDGVTRG